MTSLTQHVNSSTDIAQVQRVLEPRHVVSPSLRNHRHLAQVLHVASDEVQEGELVKLLRLLERLFDNLASAWTSLVWLRTHLVVALLERSSTKPVPHVLAVDLPRHLSRDLQVAALDRKVESGLGVLHEVQRDLRVSLLLEVADDGLSHEVAVSDDLQDLVVILAHEGELESVLGRVNRDRPGLGGTVEAVDNLSLDSGEVDGLLERLDDTVVALGQCCFIWREIDDLPVRKSIFDVVQRGVDKDTAVVPGGRLDSDRLVNESSLGKGLGSDGDGVLA